MAALPLVLSSLALERGSTEPPPPLSKRARSLLVSLSPGLDNAEVNPIGQLNSERASQLNQINYKNYYENLCGQKFLSYFTANPPRYYFINLLQVKSFSHVQWSSFDIKLTEKIPDEFQYLTTPFGETYISGGNIFASHPLPLAAASFQLPAVSGRFLCLMNFACGHVSAPSVLRQASRLMTTRRTRASSSLIR